MDRGGEVVLAVRWRGQGQGGRDGGRVKSGETEILHLFAQARESDGVTDGVTDDVTDDVTDRPPHRTSHIAHRTSHIAQSEAVYNSMSSVIESSRLQPRAAVELGAGVVHSPWVGPSASF